MYEIIYLCNNEYNEYNEHDYFSYVKIENIEFDTQLKNLREKYIDLEHPILNKNFVGFSHDERKKRELFIYEFNLFVKKCKSHTLKPLMTVKKELWKLILQLPDHLINKKDEDFIYYVCHILKDVKDKKISEIFTTLKKEFSDTISKQICDLLYNNPFPEKFKSNLYYILLPIA